MQTFPQFINTRLRDAAGLCVALEPKDANQALFSPDGALLLLRAQDGTWTLHLVAEDGLVSHALPEAFVAAQSIAFSADSQWALVHLRGGQVVLWDIYGKSAKDGASNFYGLGFRGYPTTACAFLSHNSDVLMGLENGTVCVLPALDESGAGAPLSQGFFQHDHAVTAVAHAPATGGVATCDASGRVAIFERDLSLKTRRAHHAHQAAVVQATFSPNGAHLVTGDHEGRVVIAQLAGAPVQASVQDPQTTDPAPALPFVQFQNFEQPVTSIHFSPDGRWLVVTHAHAGLTVCDFSQGAAESRFVAQTAALSGQLQPEVTISPDSRFLTVQDGPTMALMFELPHIDMEAGALVVGEGGMARCVTALPGHDLVAVCDPQGVWRFSSFDKVFEAGRAEMVRQIATARSRKTAERGE